MNGLLGPFHQTPKVIFVQDDHVIEQLVMHASYDALGGSVLPRARECGSFRINAEAPDCTRYGGREDRDPAKLAKRLRLRRGGSSIHKR